ncbi:MAG: polyphosphate kinase 2 family protein [Phycisphaerales bacterium]
MSVGSELRVKPGSKFSLAGVDTGSTPGFSAQRGEKNGDLKARAETELQEHASEIADLQERLWAENRRAVLVVLQGMDTSGKDGVIRHVFSGVNPQGCHVTSFKKPSEAEADRDYLWRIHGAVPPKGEIGIFNRAHYEDVLIVRVHSFVPEKVWKARYQQINEFEAYLASNHVTILKFMLHISKDEQAERLRARLEDPDKRWKFSPQDVEERKFWPRYMEAYQDAVTRCSTDHAPWHVVPADRKWYARWAIGAVVREAMEELDPRPPKVEMDVSKIVIQ